MISKSILFSTFSRPEVKAHLKKFSNNRKKLHFFIFLLQNRNFDELDFEQILETVAGVALYVSQLPDSKIDSERAFFNYTIDSRDMVSQKYDVYVPPRKKISL